MTIYGQFLLSAEIQSSARAFLAADEGAEKMLYRARNLNECDDDQSICRVSSESASSGGCYSATASRTAGAPSIMTIKVIGEYPSCGTESARIIKRAFELSYTIP